MLHAWNFNKNLLHYNLKFCRGIVYIIIPMFQHHNSIYRALTVVTYKFVFSNLSITFFIFINFQDTEIIIL